MSDTHDTGGVRRPIPRTTEPSNISGRTAWREFHQGPLPLFLVCGLLLTSVLLMAAFGEPAETGVNVDRVRRAAEMCPPIKPRTDALLADGRVTDDERSIVRTLVDQARAAPGGLERCGES